MFLVNSARGILEMMDDNIRKEEKRGGWRGVRVFIPTDQRFNFKLPRRGQDELKVGKRGLCKLMDD